jgi:hypothetical protein
MVKVVIDVKQEWADHMLETYDTILSVSDGKGLDGDSYEQFLGNMAMHGLSEYVERINRQLPLLDRMQYQARNAIRRHKK